MSQIDEKTVLAKVEAVLKHLPENPLGLHVEDAHLVDGRWWVFLEVKNEPKRRSEVWDALSEIEERLEVDHVPVTIAAA